MNNLLQSGWQRGKYYLGLLLAAGIAVLLVWAEEREDWVTAQASLVIILSLLALMAWVWWRENHPGCQLTGEAAVYDRATNKVLLCVAIGFAALILNANRWSHWRYASVAKAIGYGVLNAGAFFIGGVLLGYLFGLRPSAPSQAPSSNSTAPTHGQPSNSTDPPHTNLEEIADWLTKLFLGAGLVELKGLKGPIHQLAVFMAHTVDVPGEPGSPAIAAAIMGFFSASGLLYGYLWTRYQHALKEFELSKAPKPAPTDTHESNPA